MADALVEAMARSTGQFVTVEHFDAAVATSATQRHNGRKRLVFG